jgi:hypothetical protein
VPRDQDGGGYEGALYCLGYGCWAVGGKPKPQADALRKAGVENEGGGLKGAEEKHRDGSGTGRF